ncbi:MAG: UDP-N-acetylglucosamine--N-acetylmuramyl-(pentapeptide) pyrophosphoryl-undecaprenol N-acetylglucosamine transferase [Cytophagia bacterium]|nr:UDP-N-acetylglucosamine--N-acetylmuramyl-(pentapeptide) pyrophosphoryl-undecaprenol N-acetylglucosamine transferase [Cytophagia bacterium]
MPSSLQHQPDSVWKIMVSGGGTGGHVFPAISIAQACRDLSPNCSVHFVGALGKIEMTQVPLAGFPITGFWIRGFQRKAFWKNWALPLQILVSVVHAWVLLRKFRPHAVVGVGGYASGPLLWVAQRLGISTALQEQNALPGATNRFLSGGARRVYVAFEGMEAYFGSNKTVVTGNPVRHELQIQGPSREEALKFWGLSGEQKTVLVLGGSLGARALNEAVEACLRSDALEVVWLWQCGRHYQLPEDLKAKQGPKLRVLPFVQEMTMAYAAADWIVSRAGAGTMSELALVAKPCLLVPSPYVAENHQHHNAMNWVNQSLAWISSDASIANDLPRVLGEWGKDPKAAEAKALGLRKWSRPDAARRIAIDLFDLTYKKNAA